MFKKRTNNLIENKKILPRNKGEIARSITKNWTEQSIHCYKTNCNCLECDIGTANYSFICQMPKVINILLKEVGPPPAEETSLNKKFA